MDHLLSRPLPNKDECPYSADIQNFLSATIFECIGLNVAFARLLSNNILYQLFKTKCN